VTSSSGRTRVSHPPPPPRTKWTRRVPHPVLIGHAASLTILSPQRTEAASQDHTFGHQGSRASALARGNSRALLGISREVECDARGRFRRQLPPVKQPRDPSGGAHDASRASLRGAAGRHCPERRRGWALHRRRASQGARVVHGARAALPDERNCSRSFFTLGWFPNACRAARGETAPAGPGSGARNGACMQPPGWVLGAP